MNRTSRRRHTSPDQLVSAAAPQRAFRVLCHKCGHPYTRLSFSEGNLASRERVDDCRCDEAAVEWVAGIIGPDENPRNPSPEAVLRVLQACRYIPGCGSMPGAEVARVMDDPAFAAMIQASEARRVPPSSGPRPAAQPLARVVADLAGATEPAAGADV